MNDLLTLGIETSGNIASVALCTEDEVIASVKFKTKLTHSQVILPLVKKLLADAERELSEVELIAVANGPGSYTGLRIGIAAVKGMCMALGCKCAGVSTLKALAYNVCSAKATVLSVMKARKGVVYFGAYETDGKDAVCIYSDRVCPTEEIKTFADSVNGDIIIVGDCCAEIKSELFAENENVRVAPSKDAMQDAVSVCMAAMADKDSFVSEEMLDAVYLQNTKAEKDKAHS